MNHSPIATLPLEIRDMIYNYVLIGTGDNHTSEINPLSYISGSVARSESGSISIPDSQTTKGTAMPDIFALTAQLHSLLLTCRQIADEAFETFLRTNTFILNVPTLRFMDTALKCLSLFVSGLGANTRNVRKIGLRITNTPDADKDFILSAIQFLSALSKKHNLRSGVIVFQLRCPRATGPALLSVEGQYSIAPRNGDLITVEIAVGDAAASRRRLESTKARDRVACENKTEKTLVMCGKLKGIAERREEWTQMREVWWEDEWNGIKEEFEQMVRTMDEV